MTYNPRFKRKEHLILVVEVVFEEFLVGTARDGACFDVHRGGVVYWDAVDVVDASDEIIYGGVGGEFFDEGPVGGADPFAFETDEEF